MFSVFFYFSAEFVLECLFEGGRFFGLEFLFWGGFGVVGSVLWGFDGLR